MCGLGRVSNFKIYGLKATLFKTLPNMGNCDVFKPVFNFLMTRSNRIYIRASSSSGSHLCDFIYWSFEGSGNRSEISILFVYLISLP